MWIEAAERVADLRFPWYQHYDSLPPAFPVPAATLASYAGRYEFPNRPVESVRVEGDHLLISSGQTGRTLIRVSATEFLAFHPEDLAAYSKITFGEDSAARVTISYADEAGELLVSGVKAK